MQNPLLNRLLTLAHKAQYDAACKSLLSSKSILAHILKATVKECEDLDIDYIRNCCIEKDIHVGIVPVHPYDNEFIQGLGQESNIYNEGICYFDIHFSAVFPENKKIYFNLEAQNQNPSYPIEKRGAYYLGRMVSAQYGTEFSHSHYEMLKKAYSIWICFNPPKRKRNTIVRYEEKAEFLKGHYEISKDEYDMMCTVIINLGKEGEQGSEGILRLMEVLFSNTRKIEEKIEIIKNEFHIGLNQEEREMIEEMCNLSDMIEERGIIQARQEDIRNLQIKLNISIDEAMELLGIPINEQKNYIKVEK